MRLGVLAIVLCAAVPRASAQDDGPTERIEAEVPDGLIAPDPGPARVAEKVELRADGAVGLDAAGQAVWTIPHASLRDGATRSPPVVIAAGHAIYAVRGDVLRVSLADGVVVDRVRFPAVIDDLQLAKDGALDVRLRDGLRGGASIDVIHYVIGKPAPGRGSTDPTPWLASWRDAALLIPGWDGAKDVAFDALAPDVRELAIAALSDAAMRDPTNAHYRMLVGLLAHDEQALSAAVTTPAAPWTDLLHVWSKLEDAQRGRFAELAYTRALDGMKAQGVRPDRQRGLIMVAPYVPRAALAAAIDGAHAAQVDALATRLWRLAPHVEGGKWVWARLAAWFDAHEQGDLGDTWRARAAEGGGLFGVAPERVDLDAWAAMSAAFLFAIPVIALLIGLRRGAASRATPAQFPFVQLVDLASLLLPLVPAIYGRVLVTDAVTELGSSAASPVALYADAVDAETVTFVERTLPESDAKTRVLTYLRAELEAMRGGGRSDADPYDLDRTLPEAFHAKAPLGQRLRHLDDGFDELSGEQRVPTPSIPAALGGGMVLFAIGFAIARRKPGTQVLARIVPGGAGPLWAFGGLITGALIAEAIYHFTWDPWLGEVAVPRFDRLFGLEHLPELATPPRATPWWPFAAIGAAVAAQAAAAWLELRRR